VRAAIVASYDEFMTSEAKRFRILASVVEDEIILNSPPRVTRRPSMDAALRPNKARYLDSLESATRQEVAVAEMEARNHLDEDYVLFFMREAVASDARFVTLERALRGDESEKREALLATADPEAWHVPPAVHSRRLAPGNHDELDVSSQHALGHARWTHGSDVQHILLPRVQCSGTRTRS
jgi:hypothetical protein